MTEAGANKLAVALAAREAMREHRKGKPIAFQPRRFPMNEPPASPTEGGRLMKVTIVVDPGPPKKLSREEAISLGLITPDGQPR